MVIFEHLAFGGDLVKINRFFLFLILKGGTPMSVGDYRLITLSNSIYLLVLKTLTRRLRNVLD
jgi:hypothetical protein